MDGDEPAKRGPLVCAACGNAFDPFEDDVWLSGVGVHDPVTGTANRYILDAVAARLLGLARRYGRSASVLAIRVAADGDAHATVLRRVARRLRRFLRETDAVARIGRDTFAVVLSDLWEPDACAVVATRILAELETVRAPGGRGSVDVRLGAAVFPEDGQDLATLLGPAGEACARPARGPNHVAFADEAWGAELRSRMELVNDIEGGLSRSQLFLAYQPIFALDANRLVGAEALSRWNHPRRGTLTAAAFIPQAERTGRIRTIDRWALSTALGRARRWRDGGWDGWVSVNVSARSFATPRFVPLVVASLQANGLGADALVVEVTESDTLGHLPTAAAAVRRLRHHGVRVAIDDFGSGYASFRYVSELEASLIKLDRSFLLAAEREHRHARLLESMIQMAHHMDTPVISEGVETDDQRDRLIAADCDYMQGWLAGDPAPANEFETRWLA